MGLLQDFQEFMNLKKGKTFLTNELYIAKLGTMIVSECYSNDTKTAQFLFDRYVIVQKATGKEAKQHLIKKYGSYLGEPELFRANNFEKPENTTYYKLITMNNKIIASATTKSILHQANSGLYEIIIHARTLNGLRKNTNIRLADTLDLNTVKELEEIVNHQPDFAM